MTASACIVLPNRPPYHGDVFASVIAGLGYALIKKPARDPQPGDLLLLWNRHSCFELMAQKYEQSGGIVLIAENGYLGRWFCADNYFALSRGQHNGAGVFPSGSPDRWRSYGVELQPWRRSGSELVILAGRGMGSLLTKEPKQWVGQLHNKIRSMTDRKVRTRYHPGAQDKCTGESLASDLANAWAVITWSSTAALKAMIMGIPCFYGFPSWIAAGCAAPLDLRNGTDFEKPVYADRLPVYERMAWAMWSLAEIRQGHPFSYLLKDDVHA